MKFKELFVRKEPMIDISDPRNLIPDWTYIKTIPEFKAMIGCPQNTEFHKEGDVWIHTQMVTDAMYDLITGEPYLQFYKELLPEQQKEFPVINFILMCAAICHDLGKPGHTEWDKSDRQWHCSNHGMHGDITVRRLFHDENPYIREAVANLVRNHMALHYIGEKKDKNKIKKILSDLSATNSSLLMYVMLLISDDVGSKSSVNEPAHIYDTIKKIVTMGTESEVSMTEQFGSLDENYQKSGKFLSAFPKRHEKKQDKKSQDKSASSKDREKTLYMLVGLPGSGKDTFLSTRFKNKTFVEISRDKIRMEMGIDPRYTPIKNTEQKVNSISDKKFREAMSQGKDIVINNTNLLKKYREPFITEAVRNGYKIVIYVIEAPDIETCIRRRVKSMESKTERVIREMADSFEFPDLREAHELYVYKQRYDNNKNICSETFKFNMGDYNFKNITDNLL